MVVKVIGEYNDFNKRMKTSLKDEVVYTGSLKPDNETRGETVKRLSTHLIYRTCSLSGISFTSQ